MKRGTSGMEGTMTRLAIKSGLAALSLAATLAGWGLLAYRDVEEAPRPAQAAVQSLDLPPIPEVSSPPPGADGRAITAQEEAVWAKPSLLAVRPVARTRSSR